MTTEQQTILRLMTSLENAIGWMNYHWIMSNHPPGGPLAKDIGS